MWFLDCREKKQRRYGVRLQGNTKNEVSFAQTEAEFDMSTQKVKLFFLLCLVGIIFSAIIALLSSCDSANGNSLEGETSGPEFVPGPVALSTPNIDGVGPYGYTIDTSNVSQGYVSAAGTSVARLKFQVSYGDMSYNYDLPNDGTPISCPINMGSGTYVFSIWQNTSDNRYVELTFPPVTQEVYLESEFSPFVRPNYFCNYNESSACVAKAAELSAGAANQGDVLKNIYNWIVSNIDYDTQKAAAVTDGYVPNPDETLQSGKGICFDYASLAAAMLRSQGIPCKILTGYVSPDNIYHAWNMVYINGSWQAVALSVDAETWTRIDTTFAAGGATSYTGDGSSYTDRYTY